MQASDTELLTIQRVAIFCVGAMATVISIFVPIVYGLFILAADTVFVIVFPQLVCVLFFPWTNSYGAVCGYIVGVVLRVGAGEYYLNLDPFIFYPFYNENGQVFPFRTFAMIMSFICILVVSMVSNIIFAYIRKSKSYELTTVRQKSGAKPKISFKDLFRKQTRNVINRSASQELLPMASSQSSCGSAVIADVLSWQ